MNHVIERKNSYTTGNILGESMHFFSGSILIKWLQHYRISDTLIFPFTCNLMKIDTPICVANSCWQGLRIKEEFLPSDLLLESAESMSLTWWRISLPNKLSGGIKILALWAQREHLWCLATHLVVLLWWRNMLLISTCSSVSRCQRFCQQSWKNRVYFYECRQPPESQGWHTAISRVFVKTGE